MVSPTLMIGVGDGLAFGIDAEIIIEDMNRDGGQECADFQGFERERETKVGVGAHAAKDPGRGTQSSIKAMSEARAGNYWSDPDLAMRRSGFNRFHGKLRRAPSNLI